MDLIHHFFLQKPLFLIPAVPSAWTKAPAGTIASGGTMTSRPMPVHNFGMEAVVEMITVTKQKMNARRIVFYSEQVPFVHFKHQMVTFPYYLFSK